MARKLRLIVAGGWYHVVNRGDPRDDVFRTETDSAPDHAARPPGSAGFTPLHVGVSTGPQSTPTPHQGSADTRKNRTPASERGTSACATRPSPTTTSPTFTHPGPVTESLACKLTERLIGAKPKSWSEPEVTDLIGEITNMVSGDMKRRTAELGYNGLLAPPLIMQGDNIVVESKDAPISADNIFRIPELNEELRVRVFAKLEP